MNQRDIRIKKLLEKGLDYRDIARKIGFGGNLAEGIDKINSVIVEFNLPFKQRKYDNTTNKR